MSRLYLPLMVDYSDDPRLEEAGEAAEVLFIRGRCAMKQKETDGRISDLQLRKLGLEDTADRAAALVEAGIWTRTDGGYFDAGFLEENPTAAELENLRERKRTGGRLTSHKRWHADKPDPACPYCPSSSDSSSDSSPVAKRKSKEEEQDKMKTNGSTDDDDDSLSDAVEEYAIQTGIDEPSVKVRNWLQRLVDQHGLGLVIGAIQTEPEKSRTGFLERVQTRLEKHTDWTPSPADLRIIEEAHQ